MYETEIETDCWFVLPWDAYNRVCTRFARTIEQCRWTWNRDPCQRGLNDSVGVDISIIGRELQPTSSDTYIYISKILLLSEGCWKDITE